MNTKRIMKTIIRDASDICVLDDTIVNEGDNTKNKN